MKKHIITILLTLFAIVLVAQNNPVGMRMEIVDIEEDDNEYSIFTYKDEDGTFGYYLSLGHIYHLLEIIRDDIDDFSIDHINETCLWLGATAEEAFDSLEFLLSFLQNDPGTTAKFRCRMSTGGEQLGDNNTANCEVVKRFLQRKRLNFQFSTGNHTAETDLTKSAIKSLRRSFKFYQKLHPNQ